MEESSQQYEETVKQSAIKTLMVLDSMDHALDHQEKCMEARAKTLDRKSRETFLKMNPKVIKPKDSIEVTAVENDDAATTTRGSLYG